MIFYLQLFLQHKFTKFYTASCRIYDFFLNKTTKNYTKRSSQASFHQFAVKKVPFFFPIVNPYITKKNRTFVAKIRFIKG